MNIHTLSKIQNKQPRFIKLLKPITYLKNEVVGDIYEVEPDGRDHILWVTEYNRKTGNGGSGIKVAELIENNIVEWYELDLQKYCIT